MLKVLWWQQCDAELAIRVFLCNATMKRQRDTVGVLHFSAAVSAICIGRIPAFLFFPVSSAIPAIRGGLLAKPNYQFEKRQRDLAKKNKQEEKRRQKLAGKLDDALEAGATDSPPDAAIPESVAST